MSLPRAIREFLRACVGPDWPGRQAQAERLLERYPEPLARFPFRVPAAPARARRIDKSRLPFPAVAPGPSKDNRDDERTKKVRDIRFRVMRRARGWFAGRCEWCRQDEAVHMHHVLKGAERRELEDDATCAALCSGCDDRTEHAGADGRGGPAWARAQALAWSRRLAARARRENDAELAARLDHTAEILEGKIALADAQARPVTPTPKETR